MSQLSTSLTGMRELQDAYAAPWVVADRWREDGGRVIGLVGNFAPRELVLSTGMLPIRLDADRLGRGEPAGRQDDAVAAGLTLLEGLAGELPPPQLAVLEALISREMDWLDGLLIGRDSEAHTKLFYLLREMAADPEFTTFIPPFAFSDVLRLPSRTSAVYNRRRLRELRRAVADWGSGERGADDLGAVIDREIELDRELRRLESLRAASQFEGSEMLLARRGARVLPPDRATAALASIGPAAEVEGSPGARPRVFITGSEVSVEVYRVLEDAGLGLVGDDHADCLGEWDRSRMEPIDWLADRYHCSTVSAARAGLDRVAATVERARALDADAIVQLLLPEDEASEWELAELRRRDPAIPVLSVRLERGGEAASLRGLAAELTQPLTGGRGTAAERDDA